jgi:hypothetical protein
VLAGAAGLLLISAASTAARRPPARRSEPTIYSLVHGCYAVRAPSGGNALGGVTGPFRMQAASLGVYLLYTPQGGYAVDHGGGQFAVDSAPGASALWQVSGRARSGFTLTNTQTKVARHVKFVRGHGCATYPEAGIEATGKSFRGASPESSVLGTVEGHAHVTAFELFGGDWHCGRPWSPFGAPYALPASCADKEQGTNGEVESFVDFGGATRPSNMHGWPTFVDWPSPTALAEEGDYYTGIERAWKAGLRVMVTNLVDNEALCGLMSQRRNPCNDMASVRIQSRDLYGLQNYIDAQSGGPGKGWFRVVTDPFQARRVINHGKLAVIEGIEVSRIFGCGVYNNVPQCNPAQVDAGLAEIKKLGVRTFFPVHEFNNAFGGTKMIAGQLGLLINAGNREETGSFWRLQSCPAQDQDAEQMSPPAPGPTDNLLGSAVNGPLAGLTGGAPLPVYGSGPQCNTQGLTSLGAYLVGQIIKQHLLIQLDHMDSKTATAALSIAEAHHYSGVISAHCCSSAQLFQRVYATGGFISPPVQTPGAFVSTWKSDRALSSSRYHFGFGYGSDMNGLAEQPGPVGSSITYPFKSYVGNVTFGREQWGQRTFALGTDGLANYGMYADWLHAVQQAGGAPVMNDMFQGAEAYLDTWERADGVPATSCRAAAERLSSRGLGAIHLGASARAALFAAGQPAARTGRSYRYCVTGEGNAVRVRTAFNSGGRIALVGSNAAADRIGGLRPGSRVAQPYRLGRALAGVRVGRRLRRSAHYVYGVRGGRITFVAVASGNAVRRASRLRADLRAAGL